MDTFSGSRNEYFIILDVKYYSERKDNYGEKRRERETKKFYY